ncbi:MAG: SRPBCC family protein [Anaerolineales bacterium]|nr:SRPBCC family protein [Anaerolineales bacterium]
MYTIYREQTIPASLEEAWAFLSNPYNLARITPPEMEFKILDPIPEDIFDGLLIKYRIKIPYLGRRLWVSEIKHVRPQLSFVDEQRAGPYKFWYHYHQINQVAEGVKFLDHVTYQLPYGPLGKTAHLLFVRRSLQQIFDHRKQILSSLF